MGLADKKISHTYQVTKYVNFTVNCQLFLWDNLFPGVPYMTYATGIYIFTVGCLTLQSYLNVAMRLLTSRTNNQL